MQRFAPGRIGWRCPALVIAFALALLPARAKAAAIFEIAGKVTGMTGNPIKGATIDLVDNHGDTRTTAITDSVGNFRLSASSPGEYELIARLSGYVPAAKPLLLTDAGARYQSNFSLNVGPTESVVVTSDANQADLLSPDPAERVLAEPDLLEANPGRPGVPVSIPGVPVETASGGIKAPQYFAPGVAGDHGEPIAQFLSVGGYLVPNNLSANAHGNGYADPNILIPPTLAWVQADGGAFNVLEGNHAVNLAATYGFLSRFDPFLTLSGDDRDIDVATGLSSSNSSWLALEASYGNGFLKRQEHRQQYKINGERVFESARQRIILIGIGYYGSSFIPGLVPIAAGEANAADTIDPRQKDQTHTALLAIDDDWMVSGRQQLQFAGFFRTYNLALYSNFGQGLIRQSEFRTVAGGNAAYIDRYREAFSVLAGIDFQRDAPRRDDLDRYGPYSPGNMTYGPFTAIDASNLTISPVAPFVAAQGKFRSHFRYYAGWRRDQIGFENQDLLKPENSFHKWIGVNSPKVTVSASPGSGKGTPVVSASFGESFFTEDPRIGLGSAGGSLVSRAHSWQLVAAETLARTEFRLTLGQVTKEAELARIDPDTGLQENLGPGRMRFLTAAVHHAFNSGSLLVTFSKADARDTLSGEPTPEAPRTIFDALGVADKLPFRLRAKGEFEYVGAKPLGTGCAPKPSAQCIGVSINEFRLNVARMFREGRYTLGLNLLAASGYSGQTLETIDPATSLEPVGVRIPPYASVTFSYRLGTSHGP